MLSRRHLRIKVVQALYAFFQSDNDRLDIGEKQLLLSINKLYELYIHQLSFLVEVQKFAANRIEEGKKKHIPLEEDLNPNTKFIDNRIFKQISENKDFLKKENIFKVSWHEETEMIRKFFVKFRESNDYINYMESNENSYEEDKKIIIKLVKKHLNAFSLLENYYADKSIFWADDYYTGNFLLIKSLQSFVESHDEYTLLPSIYKSSNDDNEDKDFVISLFRKTILKSSEYAKIINDSVKNWEMDRIAIDRKSVV